MSGFNAEAIKKDFPILDQIVNDEPLVYLDNAATTQKPKQVLAAIENYYLRDNANVHRGVHMKQPEKEFALLSMRLLAEKSSLREEPRRVSIGWLSLRLKGCSLVTKC